MSSTTLTIRTDTTTKKAIADFAASLGLSTSAFVTAITLQAVRERKITLTPTELVPTPHLQQHIAEATADNTNGVNITTVTTQKELEDYLGGL